MGLRSSVTVMNNGGIGGLGNGCGPLKGRRRWRNELDEGVRTKWRLVVACDRFQTTRDTLCNLCLISVGPIEQSRTVPQFKVPQVC